MDPAKRRQIEYLLQTDPDFRAKFEARRAERAAKAALFPGRTAPMMSGQEFGPVAPAGFTPPPRSAGLPIEQGPTFEQRASDRPWYLPYDPATLTEAMGDVFVKQDLTATKDYVKDLASQPWNFLETERAQGVPEGLRRGLESILTGDEAKNPDKKALSVPGQIAFGGGALAPFMAGYGATGLGSRAVAAGEKTINPLALSKVFGDRLMALAAENPTFANILRAGLAKAIEGTSRGYVTGAGLEAVGQAFGSEGRPVPTDPATGKPLSSVEQIHEAGKSTAKFMGGLQTVSGLSAAIPSTAGRLAADVVGGSVGVAASGGDPLSPDQWLFNVYQPLATAIARVPFARAKYAGQVRTRAQENANNPEAATETRRQAMEDVMADPEASAAVVEELKNQGVPEEQIKVILDQIKKPKASTALEDDPKFGKQPIVMRYPSGDEVVLSIKPEAEGKRVQIVRHNLRTGAHDVINRGLDPNDVPKYLKKKLGKGMSFVGFANDLTPEAATAALSETVTKFARQHSWAESYAKDLIDYYTGQRTDLPEAPAGDQAQALHRKIRKTINRMAKEYTPEDVKPDATIAEPTAITRTPESPETTTDKNDRPLSALEQNKRLIESLPTEQDAAEDASMIYTKEMMDEVRNEASDFVDIGNGLSIHRMSPDKKTWTVIQEGLPITGKIKLPDGTEVEQGHEIDLEDAKRVFGDKIPNPEDVSETPVEDAPTYSKQDLLDSVREGAEEGGVEKARASLNDESIAKIVAGLNDGVDPDAQVTPGEVRAEIEAYLAKQEPSPKGKPVAKSKDAINRTVESIDEAAETPKAPEPAKAPTPEQPTEKPVAPKSEDTTPKPTSEKMKWLDDQEAAILKRIQERRKNITSGIDPADMADFIELGAIKIAKGFVKADQWMKEMVRVLGDQVRPHLRTIWTEANLKYEKSYKDPTRARPGGEVGINGEHYEGGQFLPTSKHTVKGEHSGKSGEKSFEDSAGDQVVGVGKYSNVLAKDLFAKDPDYAIWAADNLSGKSKHIADYLRSRPEYAEAKAAEIQKVKEVLSDENKEAMKNLGLEMSDRGGKIVIGGKTYESRNIFKAAGAKFNGTEWTATAEQAKAIIDRLRGLSDATGRRGGISEFGIHDPQLVELRRTIAERPDRSGLDRTPGEIVDKKTESLLRLGEKTGMPSAVIAEQVEDVAKIKTRYEDGSKMFMLASDPGSGKTYVLGAAIRELRRSGAKNITYVTLRKELIDQIKSDLSEYDIGDVKFVTYPEMRMSDVSDSDVLIFDEAHSIKNVAAGENGAQQAKAAARWIRRAKFTIFSTATPFENPVQAEYLEPTGIFKPFGGFQNFALAHGAELFRVGDSQFLRWKRGPHSTANAKAARDFFMREGIFTSRQIRLPEGMLDARMSKIEASPELVAQYNSLTAAAESNESSLRGFGKAWVVNLQKRLLESAKVQRGIEEAKDALARGRNPIIFVETKADRDIDIPDLIRREEEYEAAYREAITIKDTPPKRSDYKLPPMGVVDVLRAFMNDTGQDKIVIPGAEKVIMDALGEENVAIFTGTVTATKAQKNLDDWRSGKKRVIVATMAKGGTGLSLHDKIGDHPTTQIVINLPWTATGVKQVAQRNARYGIKSKAEINWIFADNIDFDRALASRVGGRMADMGASVHGDVIKEASKLEDWSFEDATFSEINDGVHEALASTDKVQDVVPDKAPEPTVSPDKAPEKPVNTEGGDGDVVARMMPTSKLTMNEKRYQVRDNRKGVERIVKQGWNREAQDPIRYFPDTESIPDSAPFDPKTWYSQDHSLNDIVSGHTRKKAADRLGITQVKGSAFHPEIFAEDSGLPQPKTVGDARKLAQDYAHVANDLANAQTSGETMRVFKDLRERGMSDEYIKGQIGEDKFRDLDMYTYLNPDGKFMVALGDASMEIEGATELRMAARMVGRIRRDLPELFKDKHETEVFNFVFGRPKTTTDGTNYGSESVKRVNIRALEKAIREKIKGEDWDPDGYGRKDPKNPLSKDSSLDIANLLKKDAQRKSLTNDNRDAIQDEIDDALERLRDYKEDMTPEEFLASDAVKRLTDFIKMKQDQLARFQSNQGTLGFDNLDVSFGIPNPEKLAQLARDVKRGLTAQLRKLGVRRQLAQQTTGQRAKDAGWFSRWILDPNTMFAAYEGQKTKRYGEYARDAQIAMNLAARNILKSAGEWQEKIGHGLKDISKAVGRDGLKNVGDWLEGGVENAPENVRAGLGKIRDALDEIREALKTSLRQRIVYDFTQDLVGTYRRIHGIDQGEPIPQDEFDAITERAVKFAELRIPDDWGIDDYFPHMFFGDYRVFYDGQIIGTGRNRSEAITAAHKHFVESGEKGDLDKYEIRMINFQTPDVTKLGDKELARFISNMQEIMPLGKAELKSALSGVVVPKSRRNKYAKFMFKREAYAKGYEIDPVTVFEFYTGSAARYIELSRLSRIVQPAIEGLRSRGQESAADIMERNFAYMWGQKPSNASRDFDNVLNKAGFDVAPQALDRYLAYWRGLKNIGFLQLNPGFQIINALQPLQTLAPLEREGVKLSETPKFLDSKEGRDAVERHGVRFFFGGKMSLEPSLIHKHLTPEQRQSLVYQLKGLRPESNNQLKAWAYMYLVGLKQGKTDAEAADYAFIEGNVGSQFLAITANQPGMVQGSVLSTVNQWKPFMVKNLSLVKRLIEAGNFSGATRWGLTILALGGLRAAMRPAMLGAAGAGAYLSAQMYDKLKEEYGENFAKFVNFGLPALIGIDLSNTMTPLQIPTSVKELGGVEATIITNLLNAYRTESIHEPNKWKRVLNELPDNFPVGREINNLISVLEGPENGKYILSDPNGRMRFERDQVSAWKALLNRPLVDESVAYTIARAQKYITEKMDKVSDNVAASGINALREDKPFKAFEFSKGKYIFYSGTELFDWYKDHPQMPIQPVQIYRRQLQMVKEDRMTEIERAMSRGGTKAVKAYFKNLQKKSESQSSGK